MYKLFRTGKFLIK